MLRAQRSYGYTLIELLIVLFIFLLLTSIALPTVRKILSEQKTSRAASGIVNYLNVARSRAVGEGRYVGVRLERLSGSKNVDYGSAACLRLKQIVGVPTYAGEANNSTVMFTPSATTLANLSFALNDNQLLSLGTTTTGPIKDRDLIELPGGSKYHLQFVSKAADPITAQIDLGAPADGGVGTTGVTRTIPAPFVPSGTRNMKYRIHRAPQLSSTTSLSFSKGVAVDFDYSGIGETGVQFAPKTITTALPTDVNDPVDIVFGPDGRVEFCSLDNLNTPGPAAGLIFLCVGSSDGVRPDDLFAIERRATANLLSPNSIWIVINPATGRIVSAPFAAVPAATLAMPASTAAELSAKLTQAVRDSRALALLSDTLDAKP